MSFTVQPTGRAVVHRIPDTELTSNDVLFGRGAWVDRFPGNVAFRNLLRRYKSAYSAMSSHHVQKMEIAQHVVNMVHAKRGRFLRKVKAGASDGAAMWELVDHSIALEKIKQALRDMGRTTASNHHTPTASLKPSPVAKLNTVPPTQDSSRRDEEVINSPCGHHEATVAFDGDNRRSVAPICNPTNQTYPDILNRANDPNQTTRFDPYLGRLDRAHDTRVGSHLDATAHLTPIHGGSYPRSSLDQEGVTRGNDAMSILVAAVLQMAEQTHDSAGTSLHAHSKPPMDNRQLYGFTHRHDSETGAHPYIPRFGRRADPNWNEREHSIGPTNPSLGANQNATLQAPSIHSTLHHHDRNVMADWFTHQRNSTEPLPWDLTRHSNPLASWPLRDHGAYPPFRSMLNSHPPVTPINQWPSTAYPLNRLSSAARAERPLDALEQETVRYLTAQQDRNAHLGLENALGSISACHRHIPTERERLPPTLTTAPPRHLLAAAAMPTDTVLSVRDQWRDPILGLTWRQILPLYMDFLPLVRDGLAQPFASRDLQVLRNVFVYAQAARDEPCLTEIRAVMLDILKLPPSRLALRREEIDFLVQGVDTLTR